MFSCTLPKVADFQIFLLTRHEFYGNLSQQFNITYLLRVSARLLKEPEQVFNFLSLHNEPEPRPSRKGWSGLGWCVAFFYCQIQHRTLTTERPSAWDTRRWPRKGEPENAAGRGQEIHAGRTAGRWCKKADIFAPQCAQTTMPANNVGLLLFWAAFLFCTTFSLLLLMARFSVAWKAGLAAIYRPLCRDRFFFGWYLPAFPFCISGNTSGNEAPMYLDKSLFSSYCGKPGN